MHPAAKHCRRDDNDHRPTRARTHSTRENARGAFAPVLTNAGLPLVDGAAAFSWVHLVPNTQPHPLQNIGEYMR